MSEYEEDPSANTGRFRAFAQQADDRATRSPASSRGLLIGAGVVLAVIVIIVLLVTVL
jgi:hypothetical protein